MDDNRYPKGNILKQMVDSLGLWQIPLAICGAAALFFHRINEKMKLQRGGRHKSANPGNQMQRGEKKDALFENRVQSSCERQN